MAALAVGADLCLLHACDQREQAIRVQPQRDLELKDKLNEQRNSTYATIELCDADQAGLSSEAHTSVCLDGST